VCILENFHQLLCFHDNGVAIGEENGTNAVPVAGEGHVEVFLDFFNRPNTEARGLVHIAEGALVVGASDRGLNEKAHGLAGRTIDNTFVSQV
jgi:hypothetical protein